MRTFNLVSAFVFFFLITSCFKEDEKVAPHDPGDVETETIELTSDYRYQVYYKLETGEVVSTNYKKIWDLGFEGSKAGGKIILNTSSFMLAAETGLTDFSIPLDTVGLHWKFDASSGHPDSVAIGKWFGYTEPDSVLEYTNQVYVIDRGYDELGNLRGLKKIVFQELTDSSYTFRYANLDGTNDYIFTVKKDPDVNYVCFSFDNGGEQLELEPPKFDWDLIFTQYTTLLYTSEGDPYPYLLTGVLSNPTGVVVAQDTLYDFASINLEIAKGFDYSNALDEIGYDWKDVVGDVSTGNVSYVIVQGRSYVVRDHQGYYYKLRFISFYNNSGDKGYPTFEYQRL